MSLLIRNIRQLLLPEELPARSALRGNAPSAFPFIPDAWVLVEGERIADFGRMDTCPARAGAEVDATGRLVMPAWVDSHTHLVFAQSREEEWVDRLRGMTYEEIARRGGGILRSAKRLGQMEEEELYDRSMARLLEVRGQGTGAVEIKSGYGLDKAGELKMLRVIRRLKEAGLMPVRATYLAAHALPMDYRSDDRRSKYIELVIREILPEVAGEGLADYIDVFCEAVAFRVDEMERILVAADRYGIRPKVHVNQFHALGGVAAAVRMGAVSVDHLEVVSADDVAVLGSAQTIATLLPTAPFFLRDPFPPVRKLIDAGVAVALASDFNPGSSPSGRMPFVVSLACIQMGMYPEEALQAATLNGAFALEWGDHLGSIARGKLANLVLTRPVPSYAYLPYAFGTDWVESVIINGRRC
ncbi:MAG: hypothetical protein RLY31_2894 [Bacteroidota bacterium]